VGRGNFLEIGPLYITMKRRPCTWLHVADLIFVVSSSLPSFYSSSYIVYTRAELTHDDDYSGLQDSPVGVGFSYADHPSALVKTDKQAVSDLLGVIQELIRILQRLQSSPVYVVGESYGGKMAAMLGLVLERAIRDGTMNLTLGGHTAAVPNSVSCAGQDRNLENKSYTCITYLFSRIIIFCLLLVKQVL